MVYFRGGRVYPINNVRSFMIFCPFCSLQESNLIFSNEYAVALYDGFPVSLGHSLIIPRRHISSLFEATKEERSALFDLVDVMRERLQQERRPDGFNIGINDGIAAGQTVMHLHIHLIPRYLGDIPDPRGGVRWIFTEKADYWSAKE